MESCSVKPILLKAGIPLAFSVAGFFCAKFISSRRTLLHYDHCSTIDSTQNFDSDSETQSGIDQEENELRLINRIEELEKKEYEMEMKFVQCYVLKQHDMAYVEYLNEEISIMEMEDKKNKGFENLAVELYGVMQQLESKNVFLERKVNKLLRKLEGQSKIMGENNLKIEAIESEILTRHDEIKELQTIVDHLQADKNELLNKLNSEKTCPPSISKVMKTEEELGSYGASDYSEVIYLRRSNAFSRQELMGKFEQEEDIESCLAFEFDRSEELADCSIEQQIEGMAVEPVIYSNTCSKRRKLFRKLKKWVDGSEKMDDDIVKCFGRHSETEKEKIHTISARKLCSNA
ncbi:hypothetical protein ACFE04_020424 [Oxalis oulophora]